MAEFVEGWQFITDYKNTVSILGSARFKPENPWYQEARKLGTLLAKDGIGVVTGGGPGIMEGGNRGAYEGGGDCDNYKCGFRVVFHFISHFI